MTEVLQSWGAVIVAAGRGTRMGTKESKQYLQLADKPVIVHTLELFQQLDFIEEIVLVTGADDISRCREWVAAYQLGKVTAIVAGGSERQQSVYCGLQQLSCDWVMVHDGVRPLVSEDAVARCASTAERCDAAVLAVPVKDTIKQVNDKGIIVATPDRKSLWAIQTPQAFRRDLLIRAHEFAQEQQFLGTDDAMLVEQLGLSVEVVEGDYANIKITTPEDLPWASLLMENKQKGKGEREQ